jgi:hypothetical protein
MTNPLRVIILGATSAIAEATARLYAQEKASLLLAGRNADRLNQISADLLARGAATAPVQARDLGQTGVAVEALDEMITTLGGVDHILIFYTPPTFSASISPRLPNGAWLRPRGLKPRDAAASLLSARWPAIAAASRTTSMAQPKRASRHWCKASPIAWRFVRPKARARLW